MRYSAAVPDPTELGAYRVLEKLGEGGMASVYRGERVADGGFRKMVALKRMLPQWRRHPALLERFAAEARTNARLDHPNLVHVVDFGVAPEPYLVMEFVEGVTLAALLHRLAQRGEKLEIAAACFIAAEAAQGLDYAHRKKDEEGRPLGIVHRDVSPQNVLLSNEGAVKVSDFGLVKAADNVVQTGSGVPIGKISYMAPEQAQEGKLDARADVFSLGVVTWEMLTMRPLLPPNDPKAASEALETCAFPSPSEVNGGVHRRLDALVMGYLRPDPGSRTPSAQAMSLELREVLHGIAPGYGREQLARLLSWAFPERGWSIDEPHETAKQPGEAGPEEERVSAPPLTPTQQPVVAPALPATAPPLDTLPGHPSDAKLAPRPSRPEAVAPKVGTSPGLAPATPSDGIPRRSRPSAPTSSTPPRASSPVETEPPSRGMSTVLWAILLAVGVGFVILLIAVLLVLAFQVGRVTGVADGRAPAAPMVRPLDG